MTVASGPTSTHRPMPASPALSYQAATPADLPWIAQLWHDAWASANPHVVQVPPLTEWQARALTECQAPAQAMRILRDGVPIGFYVVHAELPYLDKLFIAPAEQGQGVGGAVLAHLRARFPHGFDLHVAADNPRAQAFYARHGLRRGSVAPHPVTGRLRIQYQALPA